MARAQSAVLTSCEAAQEILLVLVVAEKKKLKTKAALNTTRGTSCIFGGGTVVKFIFIYLGFQLLSQEVVRSIP